MEKKNINSSLLTGELIKIDEQKRDLRPFLFTLVY